MTIKQALIIVALSVVLGLGVNPFSPNAIPVIGEYRDLQGGEDPVVPPEAMAGDPPFFAVDRALLEFTGKSAIFIDARDLAEFECGTIPGSVNIPFDYLPEGDLGVYFDSCLAGASKDTLLITFCSGEECDLSLHLARNFQDFGYNNLAIFFGGSSDWGKLELELERRRECGE